MTLCAGILNDTQYAQRPGVVVASTQLIAPGLWTGVKNQRGRCQCENSGRMLPHPMIHLTGGCEQFQRVAWK